MAEPDQLDRAGRRLLDAYRAHTGPSPEVSARLLAAVQRDAEDRSQGTVIPLRRRGWVAPAAVLAAAAAALLAMWLRPDRLAERRDDRGAAAAHAADEPGGAGEATVRPPPVRPPPEAPATTSPEVHVSRDSEAQPRPARPEREAGPRRRDPTPVPGDSPTDGPAAPAPEDSPPADDLAAEMQRMRAAQLALGAGDPAAALAHLDDHARRFPGGLLQEEARALRAIALCKTDRRSDGRAAAQAFLAAHPGSMFGERVRAACEANDGATMPAVGGHSPAGPHGPPPTP